MPAKGVVNNPKGRPKGSKNEKTKAWEALSDYVTEGMATKLKEEIHTLSGKDYINACAMVLEYFKPKLQRSESSVSLETDEPIQFILPKK